GLFYESHQAQWVRGERSTAQLLVEPQNQLTGKQPVLTDTSQPAQPAKAPGDSGLPIAKELLPLVQQQLHTLETHQLTWAGQVWPGQEMQWEIQGQPEHQAPRQQREREWSTEMELALPRLGDVHARLVFAESGLRMTLHAADAGTIDLFNRALPQLRNALADAGIPLTAAVVEKS
ncbi:MAG TPA: flagellar hook-length control protein FliK, partial [Gallionella sp.]|nr:flagellar hook-length control protein FliK [Gallionella sp.]